MNVCRGSDEIGSDYTHLRRHGADVGFTAQIADRAFHATEQDFTLDTITAAVEMAVSELHSVGWRVTPPERAEVTDAMNEWADAIDARHREANFYES